MFQTAHMEAGRQAHEVSGLLQREIAQKKIMDERLDEDLDNVRMIPEADALRTEERERQRRNARGDDSGHEEGGDGSGSSDAPAHGRPASAGSAEGHLDLLA